MREEVKDSIPPVISFACPVGAGPERVVGTDTPYPKLTVSRIEQRASMKRLARFRCMKN